MPDEISSNDNGTTTTGGDQVGVTMGSPVNRDIIKIDLATGTVHRSFLDHVLCMDDAKANVFGVELYYQGEPVQVSNMTCTGYFIRPNGDTVTIQGNVPEITTGGGQIALVQLPQACYAYDGQFTLVIKVHKSQSSTTTTVRIIDGTVVRTRTGIIVDPGIPIPDIDELLSIIAAAEGHTYEADHGITLSGATFRLTESVRKHINCLRMVHIGHGETADLGTASPTAGYLVVIWKCGTGGTNGIKFAHVTGTDTFSETNIVNTGTDNCQLAFDSDTDNDNADPHWTITNGHASVDMRAIVLMSSTSEVFC